MSHPSIFFAFIYIFTCASAHAAPSVLVLDSGEQLIGEILPQSNKETIFLQSAALGELQLPRTRVLTIKAKAPSKPKPETKTAPKPSSLAKAQKIEEAAAAEAEEQKIIETLKQFKAPDHWSGNLRLGINLSQGDNKWTESYVKGKLEIDPKNSPHFYRFTGSYTYRETERSNGTKFKSTDIYDTEFIYRRDFHQNWFVQNAVGMRVDQVKGIDRELQEAVGIGYRYKPSNQFNLLFGGGGGIEEFQADFEDTRAGLNPLFHFFQEATWTPLQRTTLVQKFNYYLNPENSAQFTYEMTAAIRVRLTDLLGFEFSYNKSFDNDIGNGNAQDDTQWRNALVVYF